MQYHQTNQPSAAADRENELDVDPFDRTIWQDVYRPRTSAGDVYLKLTVIEDVLIVSFKEL